MLDDEYMTVALQLAESVKGQTTPNPPVGAIVVKNGEIVGIGAHLKSGDAHAEVTAIEMAGERAHHATLYVTLEPCSHYGKTPPCADLIIEHKLERVVVSCIDQNGKVSGRGIKKLINAGINVETGLLEHKTKNLYKEFFYFIKNKRPYVTLKTAMSLDGKIASSTGESQWITNEQAREDVHYYRHQHDAILVGVNTVLHDNPKLTSRIKNGRNPIRIILDTHLRTPKDAHIVNDGLAETWIFVNKAVSCEKINTFKDRDFVKIIQIENETITVNEVLKILASKNITTLFVEGGSTVNASFLQAKIINQIIIYAAPIIIGGKRAKSPFAGEGFEKLADALKLKIQTHELIGDNIKIIAERK